jgi:hypothetical protein
MKRLKLTAALWGLGMLTACPMMQSETIEAIKARQVEARNNLGAITRFQQAYYFQTETFATSIEEINRGYPPHYSKYNFPTETENYRYGITTGDTNIVAIITASSKRSGLKSYTVVVWVSPTDGENFPYARYCKTNEPSMSAPSITISTQTNGDLEYQCGDDSSEWI